MGLRCLLGHDFGEPELQREREEDGNEVVTTVTEVKTCARCGETQIVSENTEVTTMEQLTDEVAAASADAASTKSPSGGSSPPGSAAEPERTGGAADERAADIAVDFDETEATDDDAVILDDGPSQAGEGKPTAGDDSAAADAPMSDDSTATVAESEPDTKSSAEDDGAELLDDGPSAGDAEKDDGEEADALEGGDGVSEYVEYPDGEPTGTSTNDEEDAETDDGVILDEDGDSSGDRERGAWPAVDEDETAGAEPTPWPEQRGDDEGFSAEIDDGEAEGAVEFGGGLTPEVADGSIDDADAEYVEAPERNSNDYAGDPGRGDTGSGDPGPSSAGSSDPGPGSAGSRGTGSRGAAVGDRTVDEGAEITRGESPDIEVSTADVTTEYYCPECEMTRDADGNSMRAGDICPECKRGYVDERPI
ncbi:DUF7093 family protein [Halorubrum trueperi]|uniref:Oxidoreductase n=1 Tax=Halorubrum trueperi TaxID=2004704 RepID=A0ABD5UNA8_9EURY